MTRFNRTSLLPSLRERLHRDDWGSQPPSASVGVLLSYTGVVDGDVIPHLVQLAERALHRSPRTRKEIKRATFVLIEAVQNVLHHGHIDEHGESSLYLTLEHTPLGYQLHCGNLMAKEEASTLTQRIGDLNNLSRAELRKAYIDTLCGNGQGSQFGNAGLGLISIAKRTAGPIEFETSSHESGQVLVTLTATIAG